MTNLLSTKQIIGISFLIIILSVYAMTGFDFDMPDIKVPEFSFPDFFINTKPDTPVILSDSDPDLLYKQLTQKFVASDQNRLYQTKLAIDSADCPTLSEMYQINTGWVLLPYVELKLRACP